MKKLTSFTLAVAIICGTPAYTAKADEPPVTSGNILITELQTAGQTEPTEEFVELYNPGAEPVDVTGWQLQYRAASGTASQSWPGSSTKVTIGCISGSPLDCTVVINPKARLLLVHTIANIAGSLPMAGGFSNAGGQVRLVQPGNQATVHDFVGYGTAQDSKIAPADAPAAGKSLKRIVDGNNEPLNTNHNAQDFLADCGQPSPGIADTNPLPLEAGCTPQTVEAPQGPEDEPEPEPAEDPGNLEPTYLPLLITEVLPDPSPPGQDSTDEFIEIYNPNNTTIILTGYQLQTGAGFRYHYTLGDTPLGPQRYLAIPSAVSKLSLANSGSGVRLIDPLGNIVFEVPDYGQAKEGQSWLNHDGAWQWSLSPTPSALNLLTLPPPPKPATQKPPKKKQPAKVAAAKPKTPKALTAQKGVAEPPLQTAAAASKPPEPPYWIIAPLILLIVGYAVYEYRQGIVKAWNSLRQKISKKQTPTEETQ